MFEQIPFDESDFADNPEPRCPCLLLLDNSGSMSGTPIKELNAGLQSFHEELCADSMALKRVEIAIVSFGPVECVQEFRTADHFNPPVLEPRGVTPTGEAIEYGLKLLEERKEQYRTNGVSFYRPWIFLITDGSPTDDTTHAAAMVKEGEAGKKFSFFSIGVQGADMNRLSEISSRAPVQLKGLQFREMFSWLSNSLGAVSRSSTADIVPLENPAAPDGWAFV